MDNRERQAAFKSAMRGKGFVAATEWVPSEHRELFRSVARALREGIDVTIGAAEADTSNNPKANPPEAGTSNEPHVRHVNVVIERHEPEVRHVNVVIEPYEPRIIRPTIVTSNEARPVSPKPQPTDKNKRDHQDRQARYAELWDKSTERMQMIDPNGKGHEARVTGRRKEIVFGMLGDRVGVARVEGIIRKGNQFQKLEFSVWDNAGIRLGKPSGWSVVPADLIASAKRRVRALHPDKGGPGGDEFNAALAELNALRGRV